MALYIYIPHRIFHLARLLYVRPETFGPYYVHYLDLQVIEDYEPVTFSVKWTKVLAKSCFAKTVSYKLL